MASKYKSKKQINDQLDKVFAGLGGGASEFDFPSTSDVIAETFDELIVKLKKNLSEVKKGQKSTDDENESNLGQSIDPLPVKFMGTSINIQLKFNDYGFDLDKGTKAIGYTRENAKKLQPKIFSWIQSRPSLQRIANQSKSLGKNPKVSLSWAIATNIAKKGTVKRYGYRGTKWFSREVGDNGEKWKEKLAKKISVALGKDVELSFKIMANEFNSK